MPLLRILYFDMHDMTRGRTSKWEGKVMQENGLDFVHHQEF
jgi:hypothetical protein